MAEETQNIENISSSQSENASESLVGDYLNLAQTKFTQEGFEPKSETTSTLLSSTGVDEKSISLKPNIVKSVENKVIQQPVQTGVIILLIFAL